MYGCMLKTGTGELTQLETGYLCFHSIRCWNLVRQNVQTCSSSLCEWFVQYVLSLCEWSLQYFVFERDHKIMCIPFSCFLEYSIHTSYLSTTYRYCEPRVHIHSTLLSHGDTASDGSMPIRFILTDATSDFTVDEVVAVGGELSNFQQQEPLIYTATFNSAVVVTNMRSINIPAHVFTDSHGESNHESNVFQWNYDNWRPTINITSPEGISGFTSNNGTLNLTFTLSERVTNFMQSDVTINGGGVLSSFAKISDTTYTATFTSTIRYVGECWDKKTCSLCLFQVILTDENSLRR
jgi:hypothetical protein